MSYFDYLCGVYDICFRTPAKLNAADKQSSAAGDDIQPKFYDYSERPINESFIGAATLNVFAQAASHPLARAPDSTKSIKLHKNSDLDIIPKSCAGDWVMRYTQNETNFNPWQFNAKFSHFELVPWRQHSNKRVDLINTVGWEPTPADQQQLRTLQKFELARTKRLQKLRSKTQKNRFRRHIKIRIIFSLELRQKKMKLFRSPNIGARSITDMHKQKLVLQRDQQLYVFDKDVYDLAEHWAYFSQRNKGVEEILVSNASQLDLKRAQSCLTNSPKSTLSLYSKGRRTLSAPLLGDGPNSVESCEKCKNRCV